MRLKSATALVALLAPAVTFVQALSYGFPYGHEKIRGVSLGGWLSIEPWVTPSLFTNAGDGRVLDEWTFCQYQSPAAARKTLEHHWDTFITEKDFAAIADAGLNHVRIPIGHWMYDVAPGEPYIQGQLSYLIMAVKWARKYGLKIFITVYGMLFLIFFSRGKSDADLCATGTPGSQNGYVNSGQFLGYPLWPNNQTYIDRTTRMIKTMVDMFANHTDVVSAIAPLNEPPGYLGDPVMIPTKKFLVDSYHNLRTPLNVNYHPRQNKTFAMVISDGFLPFSYWNDFMPPPKYQGVIMSVYGYQVWTDEMIRWTKAEHLEVACNKTAFLQGSALWPIVGEWATSFHDCAQYMNGRGNASRYDGTWPPESTTYMGSCTGLTGKASGFSNQYKEYMRLFYETQVRAYEKGGVGWVYWNWKMENADEWSYEAGLKYGWIPQHPTDFKYPDLCT